MKKPFLNSRNKKYFHICWFADFKRINLNDRKQKMMWLQMILTRGRADDIRKLDFAEVNKFLPTLYLPEETKSLWKDYFSRRK